MENSLLVIDGCAFTEGKFIGVTQNVLDSKLDAFFLTTPGEGDGYGECTSNIGEIYNLADDVCKMLVIARTTDDIIDAKKQGKVAVILAFQNPHSIENSLNKLRVFYELGVRVIQMTYNKANYIGTGCTETTDGGLTDFGKSMLKEMNRLGMVADVSHCGHKTTSDVLKLSEKPVVISHAGVLAITNSPRNKTDEELLLLKENGGVIGLSPWGPLCWKKELKRRPSIEDYVDHIDYVVNLIGIDHVGFGGDSTLDDTKDEKGIAEQSALYAPVVEDYNKYVGVNPDVRHAEKISGSWEIDNVIEEMKKRGYSYEDIGKFTGGNFMRVLKANFK